MSKFDSEGFTLSDNGTICFPDKNDGKIVRIDVWGNKMESWWPGDPDYEKWNELFYGTEHYWTSEEEE